MAKATAFAGTFLPSFSSHAAMSFAVAVRDCPPSSRTFRPMAASTSLSLPFSVSTRFLPDAFVEQVAFQRLEIEYIDPEAPKKKSTDPRNAF